MNDHLKMLPELIGIVERLIERKLTEQDIGMLIDILQITFHDGDRNGAE